LQLDLKKQDAGYRTFRKEAPLLLSRNKDGASLTQERLSSIESKRSGLLVRKAEIQGYLQAIDSGLKTGGSQESLMAMISEWSTKLEGDSHRPSERLTLNNQLYPLLQEEQKLLETRGEYHPRDQGAQATHRNRPHLFGKSECRLATNDEGGNQGRGPRTRSICSASTSLSSSTTSR